MKQDIIRIFIGYDAVESVAWHTLAHSIYNRSSRPVSIVPLYLKNLKKFYWRTRDPRQSNEFSFSRFLVPFLCDYQGYAIYLDCDMLVRCDISEIFDVLLNDDGEKAVYVAKHDYIPRSEKKYLNNSQHAYPRKNWSSFIFWNCQHPANRRLDLDYVNLASPLELHRFAWLDDKLIGDLDIRWNWLVGEYVDPPSDVKNVHWTIGGPYFHEYRDSDFSDEWFETSKQMSSCVQRKEVS